MLFEELKNMQRQPDGTPVAADDLLRLPVFKDISPQFLKKNANATVWRHFKRGDIVCREGEFGSTAFYILEGKASVALATPIAHVKAQGRPSGFLARLTSKLTSRLSPREEDRREDEADRRSIPIDAPVDLAYDHPVAELGPGELFGEMTCMNYYPRSATVRAETDCMMLEMLRNVLDVLQKSKAFRAQLDETYRRRALDSHLRDVSIFRGLEQDFIDHLRDRVELHALRARPGDLQAGRSRRQFLSGAARIRESFGGISRRRTGAGLSVARRLFRRNWIARRRNAHGGLLGARPRRGGPHFRGRFSRDGGNVSGSSRAASNASPASVRRRIRSACAWCAACPSRVFSRRD